MQPIHNKQQDQVNYPDYLEILGEEVYLDQENQEIQDYQGDPEDQKKDLEDREDRIIFIKKLNIKISQI